MFIIELLLALTTIISTGSIVLILRVYYIVKTIVTAKSTRIGDNITVMKNLLILGQIIRNSRQYDKETWLRAHAKKGETYLYKFQG